MSIDVNISNSISSKVTSKYFASKTGMDESLSDFQEKKKITGPKKNIKITVNKPKSKRASKRPRGQKDIRTALLSNKNDLVSYTKDFDTVCKQSGIDVDSQELQLAVALSKSLHPPEHYDAETIQTSLQERTVRIRTTLQEYGFTVPETKIINVKKKFQKHRKKCKLLSLTEAERQQSITDKYSQVLFQNLDCSKSPAKKNEFSNINAKLYYLATNAAYELIKNNDSFYVNKLLLEKFSNKGCLLKDWAEIPGRPVSPKQSKDFIMDISEIDCSQGELDVVLSGTLKCAQKITKFKMKEVPNVHCIIVNNNAKTDSCMNLDNNADDNVRSGSVEEPVGRANCNLEGSEKVENLIKGLSFKVNSSKSIRSGSPDLFDDESPTMFINSEDIQSPVSVSKLHNSYLHEVPVACEEKCDSVCDILSNSSQVFSSVESETIGVLKLSQSNVTKRKSNDIMEITECIVTSSHHPLLRNKSLPGVDTTKFKINDFMDLTECVPHSSHKIIKNTVTDINIDLTQRSDDDNDFTIVQEELEKKVTEKSLSRKIEDVDLTQSSNSIDDLPFIQVSGTNKTSEDTVIINDKDMSTPIKLPTTDTLERDVIIINENNDECILDLIDETSKNNRNVKNSSSSDSFDDFLYDHSDDVEDNDDKADIISPPQRDEQKNESYEFDHEIALIQNTSSYAEANERNHSLIDVPNNETELCNKSSLGKINDVSVDYDEVISNMDQNMSNSDNQNANSNSNILTDNYDEKHIETSTQSSQECETFAISDKELDYSLQKSVFEQPDINFGGISIMDDISHIQMGNSSETVSNQHFKQSSDSFLLPVNKKSSNNSQPSNNEMKTPCKEIDIYATVKTPSNREYIIKTDEVTPILDFASMSTPERNQELDKYGLKPFKRKRAIQLLTHIYNQTHPILEAYSHDELQSPSKKQKIKPSTSKSQNQVKSPGEKTEAEVCDDMRENIYETTNETIDVRDIECSADDWVFQKREKTKVRSCRVPLHIAFHNYVSCRRWLREAILRYEPVNIDVIHKDLVANGFKYDPKDLLKFLDKKCITVKTADNTSRNNRRSQ